MPGTFAGDYTLTSNGQSVSNGTPDGFLPNFGDPFYFLALSNLNGAQSVVLSSLFAPISFTIDDIIFDAREVPLPIFGVSLLLPLIWRREATRVNISDRSADH